jgi:phage host-nuclease inhibitor protein Gam
MVLPGPGTQQPQGLRVFDRDRVQINDGDIDWIVSALKASHQDEKAYHEEQVSKLQAEVRRLQERMDAAYEDKLDGTIGEETWRRKPTNGGPGNWRCRPPSSATWRRAKSTMRPE